ncbi:hypothetical protein BDW02DRAFT_151977 [Decorospora gaudefroyi]|uniref:Secreted protein n=1 Tax=Decorospora gaudefroyi TaxID=184978 RepID=A0A6A5KTC1_9PLEO|nr:hypothetical protein BDW02DRAFT_151977 [Decorospora gaudefroyi]
MDHRQCSTRSVLSVAMWILVLAFPTDLAPSDLFSCVGVGSGYRHRFHLSPVSHTLCCFVATNSFFKSTLFARSLKDVVYHQANPLSVSSEGVVFCCFLSFFSLFYRFLLFHSTDILCPAAGQH